MGDLVSVMGSTLHTGVVVCTAPVDITHSTKEFFACKVLSSVKSTLVLCTYYGDTNYQLGNLSNVG